MAITWEHDLRGAVTETTDEDGQTQFVFDPLILDYFLQEISTLGRDKGVHIPDEDRKEIETKLQQLISLLEIIREANDADLELLIRTAYAYALGYELSMPDTEAKAMELYKLAHSKNPEEPLTNFLFGMFLFSNKDRHMESIPYLEKALELGVEKCRFTLGMLYISLGDNEKGKAYIGQYAEENPDNQQAQLVYEAIKRGALNLPTE